MRMKNTHVGVLLLLTIWLPMIMWAVFNYRGVPDDAPIWNLVVGIVAFGIFLIVPMATIRLLRTQDKA